MHQWNKNSFVIAASFAEQALQEHMYLNDRKKPKLPRWNEYAFNKARIIPQLGRHFWDSVCGYENKHWSLRYE